MKALLRGSVTSSGFVFGLCASLWTACAGNRPPPPVVAEQEEPANAPPPPPAGPTRTNFKEISKKLVQRCVSGGWISRWRSEGHLDVARPKIYLSEFEDRTGQNLDQTYLQFELSEKMRMSGVYDMVPEKDGAHFVGRGRLLRMAEQDEKGRYNVYTATLDFLQPDTQKPDAPAKVVASCNASVAGEM